MTPLLTSLDIGKVTLTNKMVTLASIDSVSIKTRKVFVKMALFNSQNRHPKVNGTSYFSKI